VHNSLPKVSLTESALWWNKTRRLLTTNSEGGFGKIAMLPLKVAKGQMEDAPNGAVVSQQETQRKAVEGRDLRKALATE